MKFKFISIPIPVLGSETLLLKSKSDIFVKIVDIDVNWV